MPLRNSKSRSFDINKNMFEIAICIIKCADWVLSRRLYINIILALLSVGLISGHYLSVKDKNYWEDTFRTITKETRDKVNIVTTNFVTKTQDKFDTSFQLAYTKSKNAINQKSFHPLPKLHIKSKASLKEIFTNKSFNTFDDTKKLRLGELKWKLFSRFQ